MSDSDDDAAFASADEGEDTKTTQSTTEKPKPTAEEEKLVKEEKEAKKEVKAKDPVQPPVATQQAKGATGKGKKKGKQAKKHAKDTNKSGNKTEEKAKTPEPVVEKKNDNAKPEVQNEAEKPTVDENKAEEKEGIEEEDKEKSSVTENKSQSKPEDKETLVKSPSGQNIQRESGTLDPKLALDQLVDDDDDEEEEDKKDEKSSSWGWGGFGSVMKVAQSSVSTFTNQVGEGFSTVMDTLENTLGAIPPEELALIKSTEGNKGDNDEDKKEVTETEKKEGTDQPKAKEKEEKNEPLKAVEENVKVEEPAAASGGGGGWWSSWGMSGLKDAVSKTTNIVQDASKNLVTGGIDVLETVGKKAFDFIEEHDPGIHRSKVLFERGNKPNLSQMLKEAKEETEYKAEMEKESEEARKAHFGYLFDEYQGISHLEALEILSNQCEKKVQTLLTSLPAETLSAIKSELIEIKQIFEQENDDDNDDEEQEHEFIKEMTELLTELHLGTAPDKINKVQQKIRKEITDFYEKQEKGEEVEPKTMHQKAIQSLAELTSKAMEQFHKAGELILIQKDSDKSFVDRAKYLLSINRLLCTEVSILSTKFSHCLNKLGEDLENDSSINQMVTNVYLEASNSSTYIHDGFRLLLPCLQQAAIENTPGIKE